MKWSLVKAIPADANLTLLPKHFLAPLTPKP